MIRVVIESPYAAREGKTPTDRAAEVQRNIGYARRCLVDSLGRGEAPFASHLLYTQVLNDGDEDDRSLGIAVGLTWGVMADKTAVYTDLGISEGMRFGIEAAMAKGRPVEYRQIGRSINVNGVEMPVQSFVLPSPADRLDGHAADCPSGEVMTLGDQALAVNVTVVNGICSACLRRVK